MRIALCIILILLKIIVLKFIFNKKLIMKNIKYLFILIFVFFSVHYSSGQAVQDELVMNVVSDETVWCIEEPVTGTIVYHIATHKNKKGNLDNIHYNIKGGVLIGDISGKRYRVVDSWNLRKLSSPQNLHYIYHEIDVVKFVGEKGEHFNVYFHFHFVEGPDGELKVGIERIDWCVPH